jgi:hypothetical protein
MLHNHERIIYHVSPLIPVTELSVSHEFVADDQRVSFWDFLNTPFQQQLNVLAFLWLRRKCIIRDYEKVTYTTEYREFYADSLTQTLNKHVLAYINHGGSSPKAIFMGRDEHCQLELEYGYSLPYSFDIMHNGDNIRYPDIPVYIMPNLNGFFIQD